ncbi:twin-arginine translocase TatA/TatE family subunit [Caulobacter sp. S45]|uniref:twin-arginine translocase TatA/TatE family subunit n=1 Tax=Caulobacter sp. S45 TaxID=1641861 RepID=UPI00131BB5C7
MGAMSPIHWIIVLVVAAVLFGGRGKLSSIMGDAAKGIKAFKEGLKTEDEPPAGTKVSPQVVGPRVEPSVDQREAEDARR